MHPSKAVERPFAVELNNWFQGSYTLVSDDVLAGIVALGSAVPEKKLVQQSLEMSEVSTNL